MEDYDEIYEPEIGQEGLQEDAVFVLDGHGELVKVEVEDDA